MKGCGALFIASLASILAAGLAAGLIQLAWTGARGPELVYLIAVAALVAVPHLLFLGLPFFLGLAGKGQAGWWQMGLGGFLIGAVPIALISVGSLGATWHAEMLGDLLRIVVWLGGSGLAGGLAFRAAYGPVPGVLAE